MVPNFRDHTVQRDHNRQTVFVEDEDDHYYLENLREWKDDPKIQLYGWCLMTNHIHLILEPGDDPKSISTLMKGINGRQSAYVNKLEWRTGSLWEGRYKASPFQRDAYLLSCFRYVELNPVKAKMVACPKQYRRSSYREKMSTGEATMIDLDSCYLSVGRNTVDRQARYRVFVEQGVPALEQNFFAEACQRNQLSGNTCFVDEVERLLSVQIGRRAPGRPVRCRSLDPI